MRMTKTQKRFLRFFTDPSYLVGKFEATGAKNIHILECRQIGGDFVIRSQMDIPAKPPELLKRFIKPMNIVIATDTGNLLTRKSRPGCLR